jgi:(+)-trans-carveol dehydrogenase
MARIEGTRSAASCSANISAAVSRSGSTSRSPGPGLRASQNIGHYVASKHGVVGLMRTLALELVDDYIRANTIHPATVRTG